MTHSKCSINSSEYTHATAGPFQALQCFTRQPPLCAHESNFRTEMNGVGPWVRYAEPCRFMHTHTYSFVQHTLRHAHASQEEAGTQTTTPCDMHTRAPAPCQPLYHPENAQGSQVAPLLSNFPQLERRCVPLGIITMAFSRGGCSEG